METSNTDLKEVKKNWSNLQDMKCPMCARKLDCRLKGTMVTTKTRARRSSCGAVKSTVSSNYYFCFRCKFQISQKRMKEINDSTNKENREFAKKLGLSKIWAY